MWARRSWGFKAAEGADVRVARVMRRVDDRSASAQRRRRVRHRVGMGVGVWGLGLGDARSVRTARSSGRTCSGGICGTLCPMPCARVAVTRGWSCDESTSAPGPQGKKTRIVGVVVVVVVVVFI